MKHPITVMGLPLGRTACPELERAVRDADILCGYKKTLALAGLPKKKKLLLGVPLESSIEKLRSLRNEGARILVLAEGDPLFFGIGASLAASFPRDCLRILPAVSSLQTACARLALPWHAVRSVSLHGRDENRPLRELFLALSEGSPVCLLTDRRFPPSRVARLLAEKKLPCTLHVFAGLGTQAEKDACRTWRIPDDLPVIPDPPADLPVTLVLEPEKPGRQPVFGMPDTVFRKKTSCFTRRPVRAAALSLLALGPRDTLWDIGAGSGALSIEAACIARDGAVLAVEEKPDRLACLRDLLDTSPLPAITPVAGHAPEILAGLPDPDAVFIGGGLAHGAEAILDAACRRLKPGGRLVASCVLLSSLSACTAYLAEKGWQTDITLLQTAEARALANSVYYEAANPVHLVSAVKA